MMQRPNGGAGQRGEFVKAMSRRSGAESTNIVCMNLGKSLRLRRIFANGRALIVDCEPAADDPVAKVRLLARAGVDAVVLTPGLLEVLAEELGALSVILRIDGASGSRLVSVQAALEMGAEAVALTVGEAGPEALERFGAITEDARRLGMPVFAGIAAEDWQEAARLAADYGADVLQVRVAPEAPLRQAARLTGRPFVAALGHEHASRPGLFELIYQIMQGPAQGLALAGRDFADAQMLESVRALVHQGVSPEAAAVQSK
jgi:DhnA family fructose-bisphosphate aldolase class Ia